MDDTLEGTARTVLHAGDDAGGAHGDDGAPAAENAGPRAARADASFAGGTGRAIDPAAFLRISLDPALALMTPAHWAYELVKAVEANDAEFVDVRVKSVAAAFDTASLAEPLGPSGQSLLHVAAFLNRPEIAITLLCALDRSLAAAATAQKLSVRREALNTKTGDADSAAHRAALARDLDRIERIYHMKCEQAYLAAVSTLDAGGRTVLHYAAASRGVMVTTVLRHAADRFRAPLTHDSAPPLLPLFPEDGWVCPVTGTLWQPAYYEFPQDHPPQAPPSGFVAARDLARERARAPFVDARDENGATPLHYATVANDVRGIRALLELGAQPFAATRQGARPLDLADNRAVRVALVPIENALQLSVGLKLARPGMRAPPAGASTVDFAAAASATARERAGAATARRLPPPDDEGGADAAARRAAAEAALVFLVQSGEDINGRTGCKLQAPLHVAAERGNVEVVALLLANGAIVDVVDVNGCTPLALAAELGTEAHMACVQALFDNGADVNATSSVRKTPLAAAAAGGPAFQPGLRLVPAAGDAAAAPPEPPGGSGDGNSAMIALLVRLGANLEAADVEGTTPLHAAAKRGNHLGVLTLLTLGARLYAVNIRGHTALHMAAFAHHLPVVRLLCRWDAEVGKLKFVLDASGRSAYDMAADPDTRDALHTLFEAAAGGSLDLAQAVQRHARLLPGTASAPWLPVRVWEATRVMRRTALHCAITGAAKAMAVLRRDVAGLSPAAVVAAAARPTNVVADALAKAIVQRRERERNPDPVRGTGIPHHRIAPSASRIVAGVGLRFVPEGGARAGAAAPGEPAGAAAAAAAAAGAGLPAEAYRAWGGNFADVVLTFPVLRDEAAAGQRVDRAAFVPPPNAHAALINPALFGDVTRSEAAAARVVPGNELTSTPTEKAYGRIVDFLLRAGVDADAGDADGVTAVMLAAKYGLLFVLRKLLARGADAAAADGAGNTAMHYARAYAQPAAAAILAEYTPDGAPGGSTLDHVPNAAGRAPADVAGAGTAILPDAAEGLVHVPRVPKKSESLVISAVI